jgi:hypothetical protein
MTLTSRNLKCRISDKHLAFSVDHHTSSPFKCISNQKSVGSTASASGSGARPTAPPAGQSPAAFRAHQGTSKAAEHGVHHFVAIMISDSILWSARRYPNLNVRIGRLVSAHPGGSVTIHDPIRLECLPNQVMQCGRHFLNDHTMRAVQEGLSRP